MSIWNHFCIGKCTISHNKCAHEYHACPIWFVFRIIDTYLSDVSNVRYKLYIYLCAVIFEHIPVIAVHCKKNSIWVQSHRNKATILISLITRTNCLDISAHRWMNRVYHLSSDFMMYSNLWSLCIFWLIRCWNIWPIIYLIIPKVKTTEFLAIAAL